MGLGFGEDRQLGDGTFRIGRDPLDQGSQMVQEALGDDFRGRAFSLYDIAYNLAWVVAAGIMRVLWDEDLAGALLAGMGVIFSLGIGGLALWFRKAGLLEKEPAPARAT